MKRVVLGHQSDGSYGLRCSPPGYDAGSNPVDNSRLSFNSDWASLLPIYLAGTRLSVAHLDDISISFASIGYIPLGFYMLRFAGTTGWVSLPPAYGQGNIIFTAVTYIDHIRIISHLGQTVDVAYSLFASVSQ